MSRRRLSISLLAAVLLVPAVAAPPASAADPFTKAIQAWQKQWTKQWNDMVKRTTAQWNSWWTKRGVNPTTPYVAKGFTVEIPIGGPGIYVAGLGVNQAGTGAAVAVGATPIIGTGKLFLTDTIKQTSTEVPKEATLPFDGSNALSVDGKRVVFLSGIGILAKPFSYTRGAPAAVALGSKTTGAPVVSADGKVWAGTSDGGLLGKDSIERGDAATGATTTIATSSVIGQDFSRPQVSGDGRYTGWLAKSSQATSFKQYDHKTGTTVSVDLAEKGVPLGGELVLADWSWDLRRLLVTRTAGSTRTVYLVDLKGVSRTVTTLAPSALAESTPTLRADSAAVAVATATPTDSTDTNNAVDLAWINAAGTKYERQSFDAGGKQFPSGIGQVPLGQRIPRFAAADTGVASFWVNPASTGGGEAVFVRTTLPVLNTTPTTPAAPAAN